MGDRLSAGIKLAYASGTVTFAVKDIAFIHFVLFYYRQVLGVSGKMAGLALLIAMISDALTDPLLGSLSDRVRSRWGRRHPFMAAGTLPLALCFLFLFRPPSGATEFQLFLGLTAVAIVLRTALTVFYIPYLALGAELSEDYLERSSVTTYRTTMGWIVALLFYWGSLVVIFRPRDGVDGRLLPESYWVFAIVCCVLVVVFGFGSTFLTRKRIPLLPSPTQSRHRFGLTRTFKDLWGALKCRNFRVMFAVMMSAYALLGVFPAVSMHLGTFFWEFTASQMGIVGLLMITANLFVFAVMAPLGRRIEKHRLLQFAFLAYGLNLMWFIGGRLLGLLPANGAPTLLVLFFINSFINTVAMMMIHIVPASLLADIVDEFEHETGERQEGVFFAAQGFAAKAVTGFGTLVGGFILDFSGMPQDAVPGQVAADVLFKLGLATGPLLALLFLIPYYFSRHFDLTRARHAQIQEELPRRRA